MELGHADTLSSGETESDPTFVVETGQYELGVQLGRGGMGEVHKAWDLRLGRAVALKILHQTGPSFTKRLMQEARPPARVEHPHHCRVYGVGEMEGKPFISLQLIDGPTLAQLIPRMTREQRIRAIRDIAEALHAAHRIGLVHRDVKPANVLVETTADGYKPYVTDFGLAREVEATAMTSTGVAKGTPLYMSPEQARGDTRRIDHRTDVFALGVILYEAMTGRRPFEAESTTAVINKIIGEDPVPPRSIDSSIDTDVETIVMKCLEKEPQRRYDSARALADDLQAYLVGDPIRARAAGLGYRALKKARKHRVVLAGVALMVIAGLTLVGYALVARRAAAQQAALAQSFGQEVARNDAVSRYSALLPLHDTRRERRMIESSLAALEQRMAKLGRVAEGPGRYALARGYLVMERPDDARRELEHVWQLDYRTAEVSYAFGLAYSALYQRGLSALERTDDKKLQQAHKDELERSLREPALRHLRESGPLQTEAPAYVEGLIALHEGRYPEALRKAHAAQTAVPWLYEALTLEGDVHFDIAQDDWDNGDGKASMAQLVEAGRAYRAAIDVARSSVAALDGDCRRLVRTLEVLAPSDASLLPTAEDALGACERALTALPGASAILAEKVIALGLVAQYAAEHNGDAPAAWAATLRAVDDALAAGPHDLSVLLAASRVERIYGDYQLAHGEDPRPTLERGSGFAREAARLDPHGSVPLMLLSFMMTLAGDWESTHGVDPRVSYAAATDAATQAQALLASSFRPFNAAGLAYLGKAAWERSNGIDPTPDVTLAVSSLEKMTQLSPGLYVGHADLCEAFTTLAEYQIARVVDPSVALSRAHGACAKAAELGPAWAGNFDGIALVLLDEARWQFAHSVDPTEKLSEALKWTDRALLIDHAHELSFRRIGQIRLLRARWELHARRSPTASLDEARGAFESSLRLNKNAETLRGLAEQHSLRARANAAAGRAVDDEVAAGLSVCDAALALNPRLGEAVLERGILQLILARAKVGAARAEARGRARESLNRALQLDANLEREARPLVEEAAHLR